MTDLIERLRKDLWPNDDAVQIKKCGLLREAATALESALEMLTHARPYLEPLRLKEEGQALAREIDRMPMRQLCKRIDAALNKQESLG